MTQSQITQTRRQRKPNQLALDSNAFCCRVRKHDEKHHRRKRRAEQARHQTQNKKISSAAETCA
jgi:hypothetical protein